jgi:hypothetical protein
MSTIMLVVGTLLAAGGGVILAGALRWQERTAQHVGRLRTTSSAGAPISFAEVDTLPTPVQRYLRTVVRDGAASIARARLTQRGTFLLRPERNRWTPFSAIQHVATVPPGFVWDARIRMAPGITVRVRDGLVDGSGSMHGAVLGLFTVISIDSGPGITAGALHRYLAEAVWYPTALLPSHGVAWTPLDDACARATLDAGGTTVSLDFHFGVDGLVERVYTPERAREVDGAFEPTPWQGRFWHYTDMGGLRIPTRGEVAWLLPDGPQAYWRGEIADVAYERSPASTEPDA